MQPLKYMAKHVGSKKKKFPSAVAGLQNKWSSSYHNGPKATHYLTFRKKNNLVRSNTSTFKTRGRATIGFYLLLRD